MQVEVNQVVESNVSAEEVQRWLDMVTDALPETVVGSISLAFVDDDTIQELNRTYRNKDAVTDVLSFSQADSTGGVFSSLEDDQYIGEVVICYPQAQRQAEQYGESVVDEIKRLFVHGVLHVLGYDHEQDDEAEVMEALEAEILANR